MALTNENRTYTMQCDHCGQSNTIKATAYAEEAFKKLISGYGWAFDTEHGDLCNQCAKDWRAGKLDEFSHVLLPEYQFWDVFARGFDLGRIDVGIVERLELVCRPFVAQLSRPVQFVKMIVAFRRADEHCAPLAV